MNAPSQLIFITGFMGSGKTTVAAALARRLSCLALDLDKFITAREGRTPQTIIDEDGEAQFRETETRALSSVLENKMAPIIALGGGCWTMESNRTLIADHNGFTVWLDAPFELCWRRIFSENDVRPLARQSRAAHKLYYERRALYELARLHVRVTEERSADDLAAEIAHALTL